MDRSKQSISLINVNMQSICAKKLEFQLMVEDTTPDVIVACETWLTHAVNCSEFMPSGYGPTLRKDRAVGYGGVMIVIKTGVTAEQLMIPTPCELVAVKLKTSNTPLIVIGIYRPTYNNTDYSTSMCGAISSIARKFPNSPLLITNSPLLITGDTNLLHSDILPKRYRPIQRTIHVWRKADNRLIHDELATFADEIQKDHNLDIPI